MQTWHIVALVAVCLALWLVFRRKKHDSQAPAYQPVQQPQVAERRPPQFLPPRERHSPPVNPSHAAMVAEHEILELVDRSGSMSSCVTEFVAGHGAALRAMQADPLAHRIAYHRVVFDTLGIDRTVTGVPLMRATPVTLEEVKPRAGTPLNDAIAYCVEPILAEPRGTGRKILRIFTDGEENASRKYPKERVHELRRLIERFQELGHIVLFLGANLDAQEVGTSLGIPPHRSMNTRANGRPGTGKGLAYALAASAGLGLAYLALRPGDAQAETLGFTDKDRQESMGGMENWKDAIAEDISGAVPESMMTMTPDVVEAINGLSDDFDPMKGSYDNPDSANAQEIEALADEDEEQEPDSGPEDDESDTSQDDRGSSGLRDEPEQTASTEADDTSDDDRGSSDDSDSGDSGSDD